MTYIFIKIKFQEIFAHYIISQSSNIVAFGVAICVAIEHSLYYAWVCPTDGIQMHLHRKTWWCW